MHLTLYGDPRTKKNSARILKSRSGRRFVAPSKAYVDYETDCLWERGVTPLKPTNIVEPVKGRKMVLKDGTVRYSCWEMDCSGSKEERAKSRSKTFPGIAKAMSEQWG